MSIFKVICGGLCMDQHLQQLYNDKQGTRRCIAVYFAHHHSLQSKSLKFDAELASFHLDR